jgi:dTDP-4-dehydrorhamnose 3,5-epimerase
VKVIDTRIPDVKVLVPERFGDHRGFLSETYSSRTLAGAGIELEFVQDNDSVSAEKGTIRGLHFQVPPRVQAKLVRVVRGAIFDVAVDLRRGSPTRGRHVAEEISAENWKQVLVPVGFAHGFCTLEPDTHVVYKVTGHYSPEHDKGLLWNDPALQIEWPVDAGRAVLSERDMRWPRLAELPEYFE